MGSTVVKGKGNEGERKESPSHGKKDLREEK